MSSALFSTYLKEIDGLRWLASGLELLSGPGQRLLAGLPYIVDREVLKRQQNLNQAAISSLRNPDNRIGWERIGIELMQLRDIRGSLERLAGGGIPDDVELFEIKGAALSCTALRVYTETTLPEFGKIPDVEPVVRILDPDGSGARSFHIYDSYSPRLAEMRAMLQGLEPMSDEERALQLKCMEEEAEVRKSIAGKLRPLVGSMLEAIEKVGRLDLLKASGELAIRKGLVVAELSDRMAIAMRDMVNPIVAEALAESGASYQPVSVRVEKGVTLLTGANMSGKSVVLKTLALCQAMFQFGFPVPAAEAELPILDGILISIGDTQSEREGLSSYAAEMLRIDSILKTTERGNYLVLVDEPARTTNPEEGEAIAGALCRMLGQRESVAVITTHFSVDAPSRRLRVKGLREEIGDRIRLADIPSMIDYSLIEERDGQEGEPPREALRVAAMLGVNPKLIELSSEYIKKRQYAKK